jgi:hypothetical protein
VSTEQERIRLYTSKQMGDACEMLVAANLTLAGVPALKVPDNWPDYDVIAQRTDGSEPLRISVKSRTFKSVANAFVTYNTKDKFDWLAVVLLYPDCEPPRRFYLLPREVADAIAKTDGPTAKTSEKYWPMSKVESALKPWENNFALKNQPE